MKLLKLFIITGLFTHSQAVQSQQYRDIGRIHRDSVQNYISDCHNNLYLVKNKNEKCVKYKEGKCCFTFYLKDTLVNDLLKSEEILANFICADDSGIFLELSDIYIINKNYADSSLYRTEYQNYEFSGDEVYVIFLPYSRIGMIEKYTTTGFIADCITVLSLSQAAVIPPAFAIFDESKEENFRSFYLVTAAGYLSLAAIGHAIKWCFGNRAFYIDSQGRKEWSITNIKPE